MTKAAKSVRGKKKAKVRAVTGAKKTSSTGAKKSVTAGKTSKTGKSTASAAGIEKPSRKKSAEVTPAVKHSRPAKSDRKNTGDLVREAAQKRNGEAEAASAGNANKPMRPRMRRGRRPKALADYQPTHQDDTGFGPEVDYQGLEYDTGITVHKHGDDGYFSFDRYEDSEEELNFDY